MHKHWLLLGSWLASCSPVAPLAAPDQHSDDQHSDDQHSDDQYREAPTYASAEFDPKNPSPTQPEAHSSDGPSEALATEPAPLVDDQTAKHDAGAPVEAPGDPFLGASFRGPVSTSLDRSSPAMQHANLSPAQCRKALAQRKLPFARLGGNHKGIASAVRLTGPLHGVRFIAPGNKSPFGILDCRLALTLEPLAKFLAERGVVSVRVDNFHRVSARLPGSRKRSQHAYGLAMDVTEFTLADGKVLNVEEHWGGAIGEGSCGPGAKLHHGAEGLLLRNLVCEIARSGIFHHLLTPNHDAAHRDHLHLDIKRGAKTSMLR